MASIKEKEAAPVAEPDFVSTLDASSLPNKEGVLRFIKALRDIFYPNFFAKYPGDEEAFGFAKALFEKFISPDKDKEKAFFASIPDLKKMYEQDLLLTYDSDPACDSYEEIISSYPGFTATFYYRIAHVLYKLELKLVARLITEQAHFQTGVDIHPGATIGSPFFIDHGTGIVIGETTLIGHHVKMYQGVTLGGLSLSKGHGLKGVKRHPTIGNYVTIYSGASILGGDSIIGDNVVIGSNVFLTTSVPSNTKVICEDPKLIMKPKSELPTDES
jgi:serine O-acetyltransferase